MMQGVLIYGIIDSGTDIIIVGGTLFRKAAATHLKTKKVNRPQSTLEINYQKPFQLAMHLNSGITFKCKDSGDPVST